MAVIRLCIISRLVILSLCDINATLSDDFPTLEPLNVANEFGEDYEDSSKLNENTSNEDEFPLQVPNSISTSSSPIFTTKPSIDFDDYENNGVSSELYPTTTTTIFPAPVNSFSRMMNRAQNFANQYLTRKQRHELHKAVEDGRLQGLDRFEIRKVVLRYLNSVLTNQQKREISRRKTELNEEFSDDSFLRAQ